MSRNSFIILFAFLICIKFLEASFCGESALPYHLKISPKNELILGCAKPTCLNFLPGTSSHFTSLEEGYFDGFKVSPKNTQNSFNVSEKIKCDEQFGATKCVKDGEWVGGIHPRSPNEFEKLSFRCCRNSAMKKAKFHKAFDLKLNEEFQRGGDIYEKGKLIGFDYISNIIKFESEEGINYEIFINRILCIKNDNSNTTVTTTIEPDFDFHKNDEIKDVQRQKVYQAVIAEAENPNNIDTANAAAGNDNDLQNIDAQPQNGAGAGAGAGVAVPSATCSNARIHTNSGRGTDLPITQNSATNDGTFSVTVTCTGPNPNAPVAMNWFGETLGRGISNGVGSVSRTLTCTNEGQLLLPAEDNTVAPSIVDEVECIWPTAPPPPPLQNFQAPPIQPVQFAPQQPVFQAAAPAAAGGIQYGAPASSGFGGFGFPGASSFLCFSGDTLVTTFDGKKKRMDQLKINDWILSGNSKNGVIGYSKVASWIHKKPNMMAEFLRFTLENGQTLKITKKHYIYKGNCNNLNTTNLNNLEMVYAENVSINDCLFTLNENDELIETRISKIELIKEKGIYAPLTENGNLIVNDIFASCYSNVKVRTMQHSFPSFTKIIKRILSSFGLHHLSSSLSLSSSFLKEYDLIPGFNLFINIVKDVLPSKF